MTWSPVGAGGNDAQGSSTSASVTHGLSINANDLVCMYVNYNNNSGSMTPVQGTGAAWTAGMSPKIPTGSPTESAQHALWWKSANGTEPSAFSVTLGTSAEWGIVVIVMRGTAAPVVDAAANETRGNGATTNLELTAGQSQTVAAGAVSVMFGGKDARQGAVGYSFDNSYTGYGQSGASQDTGGCYRVFASETTINFDVDGTTGDSPSDTSYAVHMSFLEGGGPNITDVNTTESWTDGDTGLVITGTGFV